VPGRRSLLLLMMQNQNFNFPEFLLPVVYLQVKISLLVLREGQGKSKAAPLAEDVYCPNIPARGYHKLPAKDETIAHSLITRDKF